MQGFRFNAPPGWPPAPEGWEPPEGWRPDPSWPPAPPGWAFWVPEEPAPPSTAPPPIAASPTHADSTERTAAAPVVTPPAQTSDEPGTPDSEPTPTSSEPHGEGAQAASREIAGLRARIADLERALEAATSAHDDIIDLDDARVLQEVGIYNYHHPLENSDAYKERLAELQIRIADFVKRGEAVLVSDMFTFNNSLAKGRKMTSDFSKLMLRAYNSEADACVRSLRAGNLQAATRRLDKAVATIARLGTMMEMRVNPEFHALRIEELELTADFQVMLQAEREAAREERARLREERLAEQELAAETARLDKERAHLARALAAVQADGDEDAAAELELKLAEVDKKIEDCDFRAANIRAGYVYVISNQGAFGPHVVKIGMTRRLEPMDRVRELGDASVPFPFDVHALFFSEDAVALEADLHREFEDLRVNRVNLRREFFFATPSQVREVLQDKVGNLVEFTEHPDADQYFQSRHYWNPQVLDSP